MCNIEKDHYKAEFSNYCPGYPYLPSILPAVRRIIAIGDIHGDLKYAQTAFLMAGLMDQKHQWTGGDTVVVQTGDQIDSGYRKNDISIPALYQDDHDPVEDLNVLEFMTTMDSQARHSGGAVYSLLGNHEIMNVQGDLRFVSYNNLKNFKYKGYRGIMGRKETFKPGGPLAKFLACTRNSAIFIGSNLFMHADIFPFLDKYDNIKDPGERLKFLNSMVRKWLLGLVEDDTLIEEIINYQGDYSSFWGRILGEIPSDLEFQNEKCKYVREIIHKYQLKTFKIGQIIVAHTPQRKGRISSTCDHMVYRIDIGTNRAFRYYNKTDTRIEVLEILNDKIFKVISQPYNPLPTIGNACPDGS